MKPIYLVIGAPGSGKTWVCKQLTDKFDYLPHDDFMAQNVRAYVVAAERLAKFSEKPVLLETPFSVTQIMDPLTMKGLKIIPVFIIESESTTKKRYEQRENKPIPQGHLSRIKTYIERARLLQAFSGTSSQVLEHLKGQA